MAIAAGDGEPTVDQDGLEGQISIGQVAYVKGAAMPAERHVRLFRNGRNQAVRIPREFELPGDTAIMRKVGGRLIIEAEQGDTLLALLARIEPWDEEFPQIEDRPPERVDL